MSANLAPFLKLLCLTNANDVCTRYMIDKSIALIFIQEHSFYI